MMIHSMTATFGKLENESLSFRPGLNVIHAPNEWGKSTWCAFLVNMLYGLETRVKTTKTALADKERYAPWSGSPMAGRIELNWNGRDITIERWTRGRTPMGEFKAYETDTGLPVPELTGANCGEQLLGVERSVFLRAGFIRLTDLPVTQDESLRRRLNALVTTGDESGTGDVLARKLKDLKNRCRYNRSGLLPQAQLRRQELEQRLTELQSLQQQAQRGQTRMAELQEQIDALENHEAALAYAAAEENLLRVDAAKRAAQQSAQRVEELERDCAALPDGETAQRKLSQLRALQQKQLAIQMDGQMLPPCPQEPAAPDCFAGLDGAQARKQAQEDFDRYQALLAPLPRRFPLWIFGVAAAIGAVALLVLRLWLPGIALALSAGALVIAHLLCCGSDRRKGAARRTQAQAIASRYGGSPEKAPAAAEDYCAQRERYRQELENYAAMQRQSGERLAQVNREIQAATGGMPLSQALEQWLQTEQKQTELLDARRELVQAQRHARELEAATVAVQRPERPDTLTCTAEETRSRLYNARFELKQRQTQYAQSQGRMEALGTEQTLTQELTAVQRRIEALEDTYAALELAQNSLEQATQQLQRRFAPRIVKAAQENFARLTGGRYDRLTLSQDLSVQAGAGEEPVLRSTQWRSEGTVDQLYLALRLAVSKELTADAPLVLDDALVRFDDTRHGYAMELLRQQAQQRQILLFSCQKRELEAQ